MRQVQVFLLPQGYSDGKRWEVDIPNPRGVLQTTGKSVPTERNDFLALLFNSINTTHLLTEGYLPDLVSLIPSLDICLPDGREKPIKRH